MGPETGINYHWRKSQNYFIEEINILGLESFSKSRFLHRPGPLTLEGRKEGAPMAVEKINQLIAKTQEYMHWADKILTEHCGCEQRHQRIKDHVKACLEPLKTRGRNATWERLNRHVLVTLFCADQYRPEIDRSAENADERFKNLTKQKKAISKFNSLIKEDPDFGVRFFLHACVPFNSPGKLLFHIPEGQHDLLFKSVLSDYESSLQSEINAVRKSKKRTLIHRGGLHYCQFNSDGKKAVIQDIEFDSKLFHLTFIFRHFTEGELDLGIEAKKMPKIGEPRYDLTAKILKEDSNNILKHIDRLEEKGVYICPWPPSL